jgi:hypothetical protein
MNIFDVLGLIGALTIGWFYFYAQYRYTFLNTFTFFIGNIIGSILIISSLVLSNFNLPSFVIEVLWISVSFFGIYKYHVTKEGYMEDLTMRQNEFSIDNLPTELRSRYFTKDDMGVEILFKQDDEALMPEKSMSMNTFLFNGTTMLTPSAISNSTLGILDVENKWRLNKSCYFVKLKERDYTEKDMIIEFRKQKIAKDTLITKQENKPILFLITGFMNKAKSSIKNDGTVDDSIFSIKRPGLTVEAAKYISKLDIFGAIVIDSISFEPKEGSVNNGFETTRALMNINEGSRSFTPLIYHAKTPNMEANYSDCSIRLGNVPYGIIPGFPVSIKVK